MNKISKQKKHFGDERIFVVGRVFVFLSSCYSIRLIVVPSREEGKTAIRKSNKTNARQRHVTSLTHPLYTSTLSLGRELLSKSPRG